MQKYPAWLKTAAVLQFIAALIHAATLFVSPSPGNETERQLFSLMDTYRFDFGAGFHRSMNDLVFPLSACYVLVCLLGSLLNWHLLRKKATPGIMTGVININLLIFGILLVLTVMFAFLMPIIISALIFLPLLISRIMIARAVAL